MLKLDFLNAQVLANEFAAARAYKPRKGGPRGKCDFISFCCVMAFFTLRQWELLLFGVSMMSHFVLAKLRLPIGVIAFSLPGVLKSLSSTPQALPAGSL